jgi:ribonuclease BN (tRNA processing enzyme)
VTTSPASTRSTAERWSEAVLVTPPAPSVAGAEPQGHALELAILGSGSAFSSIGHNAGYLVDGELLLDCGAPVISLLAQLGHSLQGLGSVLISHLHADHVFHLPTLVAARALQCRGADPLRIVGPRGTGDALDKLGRTGFGDGFWEEVIGLGPPLLEEWEGGRSGELGAFRVRAFTVEHSTHLSCLGYSLEREGIALGYSGDSTLCPGIRELAGSVEYLLCECTSMSGPAPIHLWREEVEQLIRDYPNTSFILTHLTERAPVKGAILASDGLVLRLRPSGGG